MDKEKLYWIELCAFDKDKKDFGIENMLQHIPQRVDGFVILFANVQFYHAFVNTGKEYNLTLNDCIYGGAGRFAGREDLLWTNFQLKEFVGKVHSFGLKVYATVFDFVGGDKEDKLLKDNNTIYQYSSDGVKNPIVDLTASLLDGSSYAVALGQKVSEVIEFYGFDGAHFGDGISSRRLPLQVTCYSPERLKEFACFVNDANKSKQILKIANEEVKGKKEYRKRSDKIWNEYREEWVEFCCKKWENSFSCLVDIISKTGKKILMNGAWLRDTFESKYRYGMDLQTLDLSKVSAYILNDVNRKVVPKADSCGFYISNFEYNYSENDAPPSMMSIWANLNDTVFYSLTPIRDHNEEWDVLSCCKDAFEAKAYRKNNVYYYDGEYKRVSNGDLYCLSTGVSHEEWQFICQKEKDAILAYEKPLGFCWLYSHTAQSFEVKDYVDQRKWSAFWWLKQLQISGMPIYTVTDFSCFPGIDMPLVCFNVERYSKEEKQILENYNKTPLIVFGENDVLMRKADFTLNCSGWKCFVYNIEKKKNVTVDCKKIDFKKKMKEPAESIWIKNLVYKKFIRAEVTKVVRFLSEIFEFVMASNRVMVSGVDNGKEITLIVDNPQSNNVKTQLKGNVMNGDALNCSYGKVTHLKHSVAVTVPGNGVNIIKVKKKAREKNFE